MLIWLAGKSQSLHWKKLYLGVKFGTKHAIGMMMSHMITEILHSRFNCKTMETQLQEGYCPTLDHIHTLLNGLNTVYLNTRVINCYLYLHYSTLLWDLWELMLFQVRFYVLYVYMHLLEDYAIV